MKQKKLQRLQRSPLYGFSCKISGSSQIREVEETEAEEALKEYHAESEFYSNSAKTMGTLLGAENEYLKSSVLMTIVCAVS